MQTPGSAQWRASLARGDSGPPNLLLRGPSPFSPEYRPRPLRRMDGGDTDPYGSPVPKSADRAEPRSYPFLVLFLTVTAFKLLLIPAYRSTDFEVHRNWLAITHSLPFTRWYYENASEWTLDYPPLFAWMEYGLSYPARLFDPKMVTIQKQSYASYGTVLFQRLSVIFLDGVFVYAVFQGYRCLTLKSMGSKSRATFSPGTIYACLMLWNVGLLMVDHIHFQYNGFLMGLLLLAVIRVVEKRYLAAALWFSLALNFKHIFLYVAPPFGIFLLKQCCFTEGVSVRSFQLKNFLSLGGIFGMVTLVSLGPFATTGQLGQVLSRLFPFQRGLTHAYWAPNFWALYNTVDKVLTIGATRLRLMEVEKHSTATLTGGLVGEQNHTVLFGVSPSVTLILTVLGIMPALWSLWNAKTSDQFVRGLTVCTLSSFLFGWHVHEKAILLVTLPYTWLAINSSRDARIFLILSVAGHYGLHPLLFTAPEIPLKFMMIILYCYAAFRMLRDRFPVRLFQSVSLPLLNPLESLYVLGFFAVEFYNLFLQYLLRFDEKLPFLPLMLTSAYAALGIVYAYVRLSLMLFSSV